MVVVATAVFLYYTTWVIVLVSHGQFYSTWQRFFINMSVAVCGGHTCCAHVLFTVVVGRDVTNYCHGVAIDSYW